MQKKALEQQRLKKEEEEKERKWREDCKLRKIDIGENGKYVVEVYEENGKTRLRACEGECNDATKVVVPEYVDTVNYGALQDTGNIKELVFLNGKCDHAGGFGGWTNLERIVLSGQAEHEVFSFIGCDKLKSIEFSGNPESSKYYAVFLPEAIVIYKKAEFFNLNGINARDDVAFCVSPRCLGSFEIPEAVKNISESALNFILDPTLPTLTIRHNLTIYCTRFQSYDFASVFQFYAQGPKEKEIIIGRDVEIALAHPRIIRNEKYDRSKFDFSVELDYEWKKKTFRFKAEDNVAPAFQYGIRRFRGWGDEFGSQEEVNGICGLFTTNVKLIYR